MISSQKDRQHYVNIKCTKTNHKRQTSNIVDTKFGKKWNTFKFLTHKNYRVNCLDGW